MANSDSIKDLPGLNDVIADDGVMDAGPATALTPVPEPGELAPPPPPPAVPPPGVVPPVFGWELSFIEVPARLTAEEEESLRAASPAADQRGPRVTGPRGTPPQMVVQGNRSVAQFELHLPEYMAVFAVVLIATNPSDTDRGALRLIVENVRLLVGLKVLTLRPMAVLRTNSWRSGKRDVHEAVRVLPYCAPGQERAVQTQLALISMFNDADMILLAEAKRIAAEVTAARRGLASGSEAESETALVPAGAAASAPRARDVSASLAYLGLQEIPNAAAPAGSVTIGAAGRARESVREHVTNVLGLTRSDSATVHYVANKFIATWRRSGR
jgi:hypothetical protein